MNATAAGQEAGQEAGQGGAPELGANARGSINLSFSIPLIFTITIKVDNMLKADMMAIVKTAVAGVAVGATIVGLVAFYQSDNNCAKLVKDAFATALSGVDRFVGDLYFGSLLVDLHCYTAESFLEFFTDYESGKVKERLKEELSKIGIDVEHLTVEIKNLKEAEEHKRKLSGPTNANTRNWQLKISWNLSKVQL